MDVNLSFILQGREYRNPGFLNIIEIIDFCSSYIISEGFSLSHIVMISVFLIFNSYKILAFSIIFIPLHKK